jgi:hypothetical protein
MSSRAQSKSEDIVYLKNGTIIHGVILELIPNQTLKIQTPDQSLFILKMEDVEKITKARDEYYKKGNAGGYVNSPDIGYVLGIGDRTMDFQGQATEIRKNEYHAISIRDFNGYRVSSDVSVGGGIGYEYYSGNPDSLPATEYIPIFVGLRAYSKSRSNTQVGFVFDIGYDIGLTKKTTTDNSLGSLISVTASDKFKGGFFVNPAIGLRVVVGGRSVMCFSFGYQYQNISILRTATVSASFPGIPSFSQSYAGTATLSSSFLTFRLGFEF